MHINDDKFNELVEEAWKDIPQEFRAMLKM